MIDTSQPSAAPPNTPPGPPPAGEAARFPLPPGAPAFVAPAPSPFIGAPTPAPAVIPTVAQTAAARPARPPGVLRIPIRIRLALWYSLLLAFVLALFSFLVYNLVTYNLEQSLNNSLAERAKTVAQQVFGGSSLPVELPMPDSISNSDFFVQVSEPDGDIRLVSSNLGSARMPLGASAQQVLLSHQPTYETVRVSNQLVRLYNAPLLVNDRPVALIQVGRLMEDINDTETHLLQTMAAGSVLALLAALGLGWLISGQALGPLNRIAGSAETIGRMRDFSRRVPYAGPQDEVGRLAAGFNTMLDRLQGAYADTQDAARRLEAALAIQQRFVADASHELRTPLTAIRGNAELLQRIPNMDPADRAESINGIAAEAQRMSRLVGDLLELARADAGATLRHEPVAMEPLLRQVAASARHLGAATLTLHDPVPPVTVIGDGDRLKQLLLILLDNALKYTPATGQVDVQAGVENGHLVVKVADTGIGIDPADLPHIFERFYRADRARSTGGTGLGLAIAGWIVQAHGGRIRVSSAPGVGSVFTVTLPLAPSAQGVEGIIPTAE